MTLNFYKSMIKPTADFLSAFILLLMMSPFILVTMLILLIANNGSIFFFQQRPGKNAKPFKIIKFKTMRDAYDKDGNPLPDEMRLTKVGSLIRSLSIDELLQLINVLKGDMSLIGPRPLLMKYLELYSPEQARRHNVKPGITGWAQINGRNQLSWQDKFKYDCEYIDKCSFSLDLKIIFLTIYNVVKRKGISSDNNVTMDEFRGNLSG